MTRALICAALVALGGTAAADETPSLTHVVSPFADIVGGVSYETIQPKPGDTAEDRGITLALSRFGLHAELGHGISALSEFEANAGPHGTSAWEGQAALSVRNQYLRVVRGIFDVQAGRITDPSSLDFTSQHVADQLLTDPFTRGALLASGFNRGNGVLAILALAPGLSAGFTLNAANPTSTTSTLVLGGTFPPFSRFYLAPYQYVGRDASTLPADEYHIVVFTPSLLVSKGVIHAHAALQLFKVNTDTTRTTDQNIDGYNVRLGIEALPFEGRLHLFANGSFVQNEVVDPNDGSKLSGELFTGITLSAGADWNYWKRNGVGAQLAVVRDQQGMATRATQTFANVGTTWWLAESTAVAARVAIYLRCEEQDATSGCASTGERTFYMTLRTHF